MKTLSIGISDRAHSSLTAITKATKKNQSDVLTEILERIDVLEFVKEMNKK